MRDRRCTSAIQVAGPATDEAVQDVPALSVEVRQAGTLFAPANATHRHHTEATGIHALLNQHNWRELARRQPQPAQ